MKRIASKLTMLLAVVLVAAISLHAAEGLRTVKCSSDVKTTAERLEGLLKEQGMTIFGRINHAESAANVGLVLRPTELIIFGNPKVGTLLMQCSQTVAIDLPLKALIWEDENGEVWLAYNDLEYLRDRHQIKGCDDTIFRIASALTDIAKSASE